MTAAARSLLLLSMFTCKEGGFIALASLMQHSTHFRHTCTAALTHFDCWLIQVLFSVKDEGNLAQKLRMAIADS